MGKAGPIRGTEPGGHDGLDASVARFATRVRVNQENLTSNLRSQYDFIVCGSGSSGSVLARRLAENPDVSVLLVEAGGSDDVSSVSEANQWPLNLGSERDWSFQAQTNPHLNGRSIPLPMGRVLGGGSSIDVMGWAHGHKSDWDFFATDRLIIPRGIFCFNVSMKTTAFRRGFHPHFH